MSTVSDGSPPADSSAGDGQERSTPPWLDREEYPFESHYADVDVGRLHYVDEGDGRPLVMLHGNPTWSFIYCHLIEGLSDDYWCIVPDFLGVGLSDKPRDWSYRVRDHAMVLETFLEELWERRHEIADAPALVCWGIQGPIFRTQALRRWQALLPNARTVEFPTAGHFVQEERSAEMIPEVRQFLEERVSG